jgi:hypothetical protein
MRHDPGICLDIDPALRLGAGGSGQLNADFAPAFANQTRASGAILRVTPQSA